MPRIACELILDCNRLPTKHSSDQRIHHVCGVVLMVNNVKPLRILIADDHDIFRHGVRQLIQSHPGWEICGEASMGLEAIAQAKELLPDIAILDIGMPDMDGLEAASKIGTVSPNTEILILSANSSAQLISEIVNPGTRLILLKSPLAHPPPTP